MLVSVADSQPIPYGTIVGPDGSGRFADAAGHFTLGDIRDGTYHVRARMLGYSPLDTTITLGPARSPLVLRIAPVAIRLATVPVTALRNRNRACVATGIPGPGVSPQLAAVFEQLGANIERYNILLDKYPFHYRRAETEIIHTPDLDDSTGSADTTMYDSRDRRPYRPGSIVYDDRKNNGQRRLMMYLPTFADLGDSTFVAAHCFAYVGEEKDEIRIDFWPADRIAEPDVKGSVYLDATRYIVRRARFELTKPRLVGPAVIDVTATTTFQEVLPLVPILATTLTEQPMLPTRLKGVDPHTRGRTSTYFDIHPLRARVAVETDTVLDHTFIADEVVNSRLASQEASQAPSKPIVLTVGCELPPSFETADVPIYGTIGGAKAGNPNNDRLTLGIRRQFRLPANLNLPVYGFESNAKVTPTLTGEVTFDLSSHGRLESVVVSATSLIPAVDTALVTAVRRADSLKAFAGVPSGRYTVALSSTTPDPGVLAIDLAHVAVPVEPLARKAAIDFGAPAPQLPNGSGLFQFVVDERGRAIPTTLVTVKASSRDFAIAVGKGLEKLRFDPAVSGNCPIKQVIQQPFQAMLRMQEQ